MGFTAMAFLWTGSQIPVYLFGTTPFRFTRSKAIADNLKQVVFLLTSMGPLVEQTAGFGL